MVSSTACPFTPRERHFYQQLDLSQPQLHQMDPLAHKFHSRLAKLHAAMEAKKNRLVKLISKDPLNPVRIEQMCREMAGIQQEIQKDIIEHILNIRNILNSEQQQQLMDETFVQAMTGGMLGLIMGYLISYFPGLFSIAMPLPWGLNSLPALARQTALATRTVRLPVSVSFKLAAISMALALVVGCVSGYLLGRRTARMKPADILRQL